MLDKLVSFWKIVKMAGVKKNPGRILAISLLNQIGALGGFACIVMAIIAFNLSFSLVYILMLAVLGITLVVIPFLNHFEYYDLTWFIVGDFHPPLL